MFDKLSQNFMLYANGNKGIQYPFYLEFLWNDHTYSKKARGERLYDMGYIHENGYEGFKKDDVQAEQFYRSALDLGYIGALVALGSIEDGKNNVIDAETFYRKAAISGSFYGLANLVRIYRNSKNYGEMDKWIKLLPEDVRYKSCSEICKYLRKNDFDVGNGDMFQVPEELRTNEAAENSSQLLNPTTKI